MTNLIHQTGAALATPQVLSSIGIPPAKQQEAAGMLAQMPYDKALAFLQQRNANLSEFMQAAAYMAASRPDATVVNMFVDARSYVDCSTSNSHNTDSHDRTHSASPWGSGEGIREATAKICALTIAICFLLIFVRLAQEQQANSLRREEIDLLRQEQVQEARP